MIKTELYQNCHYVGYQELPDLPTKIFCWRILPDGTCNEFSFFTTEIDMIIFTDYDMGYSQNVYIHVNGVHQHYTKFDYEFSHFIDSCDESRVKIFNSLRIRYPNASITIIEDGKIDVWNNKMVDCMEYKRC